MQETPLLPTPISAKQQRRERLRRWTWWLVPKPFDLVTTLLYLSVPVLSIFFVGDANCDCQQFPAWRVVLLLLATLVLLSIDRVEYMLYGEETPQKVAIALLLTRIVLIEGVAQLDDLHFSPFLYLIIPLLASLYFGIVIGYGFMVFAWGLYVCKELLVYNHNWLRSANGVHDLMIYTLGLIFAMAMANAFLGERCSRSRTELLLQEVEMSHQQLKAYAEQVAELATTKERNRLARDIHDTLGHYLTVINVQLEKALVFRDKKPQEADQAVSDAKRLASEALDDVRRSVAALRTTQDTWPFVPAMVELIEHMQTEQRCVELTLEGSEAGFSKQVLLTLYRAAQEGLTNVQKHSHATQVQVTLQFAEDEAILTLSDNGRGFDTSMLGRQGTLGEGGYGLQGLHERLQLVGGSLQIESGEGSGTRLQARVPKGRE